MTRLGEEAKPSKCQGRKLVLGFQEQRSCKMTDLITLEVLVVRDHDARNTVQEDRPSAHWARGEGRVQRRPLVVRRRKAASILQACHFSCKNHREV